MKLVISQENELKAGIQNITGIKIVCAWCQPAGVIPVVNGVTHGICAACLEAVLNQWNLRIGQPALQYGIAERHKAKSTKTLGPSIWVAQLGLRKHRRGSLAAP